MDIVVCEAFGHVVAGVAFRAAKVGIFLKTKVPATDWAAGTYGFVYLMVGI